MRGCYSLRMKNIKAIGGLSIEAILWIVLFAILFSVLLYKVLGGLTG